MQGETNEQMTYGGEDEAGAPQAFGAPQQTTQQPMYSFPPVQTQNPQYMASQPQYYQQMAVPPPTQVQYVTPAQPQMVAMPVQHVMSTGVQPVHMKPVSMPEAPVKAEPEYSGWRNRNWAIAFYSTLVLTFALMIFGLHRLIQAHPDSDSDSDTDSNSKSEVDINGWFVAAGALITFVFIPLWLLVLSKFADVIIKMTLIGIPIALTIGAVIFFVANILGAAVMYVIFAVIAVVYAWFVWKRIPFSQACLKTSISVLKEFPEPIAVHIVMGLVSLVVCVIDILALIAIIFICLNDDGTLNGIFSLFVFLWIFLFYWHSMALSTTAFVTSCGVMATWFFNPEQVTGVTVGSWKRAMTTSFGSICFGTAIEAAIRTLAAMAKSCKESGRNNNNVAMMLIGCCCECLLALLGDILNYINSYAWTQVAIYGKPYCAAAKATWELICSRGIQAIVNDDLTHIPLILGGIICVVLSALPVIIVGESASTVSICIWCSILFYATVVWVITAYIKTLFVCWAEQPKALYDKRPLIFKRLVDAAQVKNYNTQWCEYPSNANMA